MAAVEEKTLRTHPDIFTGEEAAAYLHVAAAQLPTLEKEFKLQAFKVGRATVYFRRDLDATAYRMVGLKPPKELERTPELRYTA